MKKVVIVDSIGGNVGSVYRTIARLKYPVVCSSDADELLRASHIIMPGVGHFGHAMKRLKEHNLIDSLNESVLEKKVPVLGICLGMQLMAGHSEEGDVEGLGWFPTVNVKRFYFKENVKFKIPHIGWNTLESFTNCSLLNGITNEDFFYFVHSYYAACADNRVSIAETHYGELFTSVIGKDNLFGVQFHPEKSYEAGDKLLINFLNL